jgi:membrane dipeptidase
VLAGWKDGATGSVGLVPLMEGADPIREVDDVAEWFERGVRIVGLAWRRTRYAGGTGAPGPLTPEGRRLVPALGEAGLILDLSHAAEESFFEALDLCEGPVIASHSNPRALCPGDRQLSDDMIRRLAERGGVMGIVPFNRLLLEGWADRGRPAVPLSRVADAIQHVAQVAGTADVVAIGSDFDGGFGAEAAPVGLDTIADLPRLADVLADLSFPDEAIHGILGGNWVRFLERSLPPG